MVEGRSMREQSCAPSSGVFRSSMYMCLSTNFSYTRARLKGANLFEADLSRATLSEANLSGADLGGANLSGATLNEADLSGADLRNAVLWATDLSTAQLSATILNGAYISEQQQEMLRDRDVIGVDEIKVVTLPRTRTPNSSNTIQERLSMSSPSGK